VVTWRTTTGPRWLAAARWPVPPQSGQGRERSRARGLVDSFAVVASLLPHGRAERHLTARSDEDLLAAVMDEVLYWIDADGEIPVSVAVRPAPDCGVVVFLVLARAADAEIFGAVPKAASPHHLRCAPDPAGRWSCAITVDG